MLFPLIDIGWRPLFIMDVDIVSTSFDLSFFLQKVHHCIFQIKSNQISLF